MMKTDIVVCSKDRPENLLSCIPRFSKQIPHSAFYIFCGSLCPNKPILELLEQDYGVKVVYVPKLKFGAVRALAMEHCSSDYVAMVDDDIELSEGWFDGLISEFHNPNVVAVSSHLVFSGDKITNKLSKANKRTSGGSGGAAIYNRKDILGCGNFNSAIHRGEDMELELRIQMAGKKWLKSQKISAYHPISSVMEFLSRPSSNVVGWNFIMQYSKRKWLFIAKRFASIFIMPIYYLWQTGDLRVSGVWFIFKLKAMLSYLSGRYVR